MLKALSGSPEKKSVSPRCTDTDKLEATNRGQMESYVFKKLKQLGNGLSFTLC